jgi:hypothetical protein
MPAPPLPANEPHLFDDLRTQREGPTIAFYAVGDSKHFLGLVALINSLRLVGHDEPIFVTDCGFTEAHRRRLAGQVTLVDVAPPETPHLAKTVAPLAYPSDVMILIDADIIVTRRLTELIDAARSGKVVAFADAVAHRFEKRWAELLGLSQLRRHQYVNGGLVLVPGATGMTLLDQVAAGCTQVDVKLTVVGEGTFHYPFYYLDQDVLNGVLAGFPPEQLNILDHALAPFPPFRGVHVADEAALRCVYQDGREPFALHHIQRKPWLAPTRWNVYSRLLPRLLLGSDVAIPLRRDEIPLRLRTGTAAWLEKRRCDVLWLLEELRGSLRLLVSRSANLARRRGGPNQSTAIRQPERDSADSVPRSDPSPVGRRKE